MGKFFVKQKVSPLSKVNLELKANDFLNNANPSHLKNAGIINVLELLDVYLPKVYEYRVQLIGSDKSVQLEGAVIPEKKKILLPEQVYNGIAENNPRCLFTGAHEIAHVILHSNQLKNRALIDLITNGFNRKEDIKPYEDPEWQANYMAGAILMPLATLEPIVHDFKLKKMSNNQIINRLSLIYGASNQAVEIRLNKTGLLS